MAASPTWPKELADAFRDFPPSVFSQTTLFSVIEELRRETVKSVPRSYSPKTIAKRLMEEGALQSTTLVREGYENEGPRSRFVRYILNKPSAFLVGLSLRSGSYLSHAGAVFIHGWTDIIPRTVYANKEQTPKPSPSGPLLQANIDRAFRRAPRRSTYVFEGYDHKFALLSGKNTNDLGVIEKKIRGEVLRITDLERTLIDIVVRPHYSGGVLEVARTYRATVDRVSVNRLRATLRKLSYVYPYHQAIGFYLQIAGVDAHKLRLLRRDGMDYDFYMAHGMQETEYNKEWRLFIPRGLDFGS